MQIDYDLQLHYNTIAEYRGVIPHGYTIKVFTDKAKNALRENFNIDIDLNKLYKFEDKELFLKFKNLKGNFIRLVGDDSWPLFAFEEKEYWESIYGKGFLDIQYPLYGEKLWNNCITLPVK